MLKIITHDETNRTAKPHPTIIDGGPWSIRIRIYHGGKYFNNTAFCVCLDVRGWKSLHRWGNTPDEMSAAAWEVAATAAYYGY